MIHWMEAYRDGKSAKEAQFEVNKSMAHSSINHTVKSQRVWHEGLTNSVIIFLI